MLGRLGLGHFLDLPALDQGEFRRKVTGRTRTSISTGAADGSAEEDNAWKEVLPAGLHRLSPTGFEEFTPISATHLWA
jgi:hypothetical protein